MSYEANVMTTAQKIAEILIEHGWIDFGSGPADKQLVGVLKDLQGPIAEFIEAEIVQEEEADARPADGSSDTTRPRAFDYLASLD